MPLSFTEPKPAPMTRSTVWSVRPSPTRRAFWFSWPATSSISGAVSLAPRIETTSILSPLGSFAILLMLKPRFFSASATRCAEPAFAPPL